MYEGKLFESQSFFMRLIDEVKTLCDHEMKLLSSIEDIKYELKSREDRCNDAAHGAFNGTKNGSNVIDLTFSSVESDDVHAFTPHPPPGFKNALCAYIHDTVEETIICTNYSTSTV